MTPYAIAEGNPARVLKYRYPKEKIDSLLRMKGLEKKQWTRMESNIMTREMMIRWIKEGTGKYDIPSSNYVRSSQCRGQGTGDLGYTRKGRQSEGYPGILRRNMPVFYQLTSTNRYMLRASSLHAGHFGLCPALCNTYNAGGRSHSIFAAQRFQA